MSDCRVVNLIEVRVNVRWWRGCFGHRSDREQIYCTNREMELILELERLFIQGKTRSNRFMQETINKDMIVLHCNQQSCEHKNTVDTAKRDSDKGNVANLWIRDITLVLYKLIWSIMRKQNNYFIHTSTVNTAVDTHEVQLVILSILVDLAFKRTYSHLCSRYGKMEHIDICEQRYDIRNLLT